MKINVKAFTITFTVIMVVLMLAISLWARLSAHFGHEFMDLFNSLHPHPFRASIAGLGWLETFYGLGLDLFYTLVDSLIFSLAFSTLYNFIQSRSEAQLEIEEEP